jgi:hypothetical protein
MSRNVCADQRTFVLNSFTQSGMTRLAVLSGRETLTEVEKIDILHHHWNNLGPLAINLKMKQPGSTLRTSVKTSEKYGALFPRRGRPTASPPPPASLMW